MKLRTFEIQMAPTGKGRHRTTSTGHTYTPKKTTQAQELVVAAWLDSGHDSLGDVAVSLDVHAIFGMPKSWSAKKRAAMDGQPCTKKPDWDNIGKLVSDALNKHAYADDSQVARGSTLKTWGQVGRVLVWIGEL